MEPGQQDGESIQGNGDPQTLFPLVGGRTTPTALTELQQFPGELAQVTRVARAERKDKVGSGWTTSDLLAHPLDCSTDRRKRGGVEYFYGQRVTVGRRKGDVHSLQSGFSVGLLVNAE